MKKKYPEIQDNQQMASEPLAVYEVHSSTPIISATEDRETKILASTVSVDEYFDELISLVHQDYADTEVLVSLTSDEKVICEMLSERILRAEAGREPVVSNAEVFDSICIKYGF